MLNVNNKVGFIVRVVQSFNLILIIFQSSVLIFLKKPKQREENGSQQKSLIYDKKRLLGNSPNDRLGVYLSCFSGTDSSIWRLGLPV